MSTADRLIDLAARNGVVLHGIPAFKEATIALQGELIPEASDEPSPDDLLFQETEQLSRALEAPPRRTPTTRTRRGRRSSRTSTSPSTSASPT